MNFYFCLNCKKLCCNKCNHKNTNPEHKIIDLDKMDSYCQIHQNNKLIGWCNKWKVNLCSICSGKHEKCECNAIEKEKISEHDLEDYKKKFSNITFYFYKNLKNFKNSMIKKCQSKDEKNNLHDLYKKFFSINEKLILFCQNSILIYILYQDKLNYPIIHNIKNLCNFNQNIQFKKNGTLEEFKNYLKKTFIIKTLKKKYI